MAKSGVIVGKSGTGKTTACFPFPDIGIKGLNPKTTAFFNVAKGKDLPFPNWQSLYKGKPSEGGNYLPSCEVKHITAAFEYIANKRKDIKTVVIDDAQYLMAFEYMSRAKEKGYDKYTDIGNNMNTLIQTIYNVGEDLNCFLLWHPEFDKDNGFKMKTLGNMIDNYLTLEGLFTVVLYAMVDKDDENRPIRRFVTNNDGTYPAKSPIGMFKDLYIPNDLGLVQDCFNVYYGKK